MPFLGRPLSIPYSAKKLEDFGGVTWLITRAPPESMSVGWSMSVNSNRDANDDPTMGVLLFDVAAEEMSTGGSSGFCS